MIYHLNLLAILLAPVLAYLAAALFFSWFDKDQSETTLPIVTDTIHYRSGHK